MPTAASPSSATSSGGYAGGYSPEQLAGVRIGSGWGAGSGNGAVGGGGSGVDGGVIANDAALAEMLRGELMLNKLSCS